MIAQGHPHPRAQLPDTITLGVEHGFQESTKVPQWVHNYVLNDEGLGGLINYAIATTSLAKHEPHIHGRVWCEQFLVPLMQDIHAPYKNWKVLSSNQMAQQIDNKTAMIGPMMAVDGIPMRRQFFQCIGAHPADVGTSMYLSTIPTVIWSDDPMAEFLKVKRAEVPQLPILDYPVNQLEPKLRRLAGKYVVFTCGGTTPIRTMTGEHINPMIEHVKSRGLTPVFLGKRDLLNTGKVSTKFADDTNYHEGIDLRDKTSLKTAACIMQHAACTVGIDGGLLHLAAVMKDSKIVFGYNITSVEHRMPRRSHGKTIHVTLTRDELPCIACQSTWKQVPNTMFDDCNYVKGRFGYDETKPERARACLRILFENGSERFNKAIDEAMA